MQPVVTDKRRRLKTMDRRENSRNRLTGDLDSLRRQIVDLRRLITGQVPAARAGLSVEEQSAAWRLAALERELEEMSGGMSLLAEVGNTLRACVALGEAYEVIGKTAPRICPCRAGALYVYDEGRGSAACVSAWGDTSLLERSFTPSECWAMRRGKAHWVADSRTGLPCRHMRNHALEGCLCAPLVVLRQPVGVLHLIRGSVARTSGTWRHLSIALADQISIALSNLMESSRLRQPLRDRLTGLFSAGFMEESLGLELSKALRNKEPLGLIGIEVDRLDVLKSSAGLDAGLARVRQVSDLLRSNIRKEDVACRYSEGRFVIMLPQGDFEVTRRRAEKLRCMVHDLDTTDQGEGAGPFTVSAGVAMFPDHGRTPVDLLQAAAAALRSAGEAGGDRVVTAR